MGIAIILQKSSTLDKKTLGGKEVHTKNLVRNWYLTAFESRQIYTARPEKFDPPPEGLEVPQMYEQNFIYWGEGG